MAEGKKSVLLYCDIIHTVEELEDDEAGRLFKHYLRYINDQNPEPPDKLTKIVFEPIKQTLKRDLKKYEAFVEKQSLNGKRGGRPTKADETQKTQAFSEKPKKADSDIDKDKVIDKDIILSGKKFLATEIGDLPPVKIGATKELLSITKNFEATDQDIITLWEAFKVQNLNGEKYYKSESEVQSHFINWLQTKKINGNKAINRSVKTAGAYDLLERIRKGASARGHEGT